MAVSSVVHSLLSNHSVSVSYFELYGFNSPRRKRSSCSRFSVSSSHSNPKILKSNRRSRFGQRLSPYEHEEPIDDWLSDDPGPGFDDDDKRNHRSQTTINGNGNVNGGSMYSRTGRKQKINGNRNGKLDKETGKSSKNKYRHLQGEIDVDEKWFPLLDYLTTFGLKDSHFLQMYSRHMPSLQVNVTAAKERLDYLMSVGVKTKDIKKILLRQPQILQYTVESNLKSHVAFLVGLGIQDSRIGQVITATPSIFSYSVENSLKPTVRYLVEEVGIKRSDLSKVVQLSPQILVQRIDNSWNARYRFLSKELGAPRDSIVKMVTKHPQLLHYSIEDGLLPRINFLRSIGMHNSEILKVSTSLTQVFSLSLEGNLKPKYLYLVNELQNEVKSLTKYPTYLSLSLDQRIRPRHKFLVALKKAPNGPFPLSSFVPNDESFCQQWAGTSLDKYLAFRQRLLLKDLAKKYERP
ncbi:transcription termination factor MTERF9, chloroplastic-like [Bidens hawaiensis]|uniref:transcription termination factor MTERF9, chloroplastic-like n=1 Tax=Bidens hawaiensis TaxID=980011 RepID=UPI00404AE971